MAEPSFQFTDYKNKYLKFTGNSIEPNTPETMDIFLKFIMVDALMDIRVSLDEQRFEIEQIKKSIMNLSK